MFMCAIRTQNAPQNFVSLVQQPKLSRVTAEGKKGREKDGGAAEFQSSDHQTQAPVQAASLEGFPCHSYLTRLNPPLRSSL